MPLCYVDFKRSPSFTAAINCLKKRFPRIEEDLAEIWPMIAMDYRNACGAESIPTFHDTVFKYRSKSRDMHKGASNAFRVIGYYHAANNTLYPIFVYPKADMSSVPNRVVGETIKELAKLL